VLERIAIVVCLGIGLAAAPAWADDEPDGPTAKPQSQPGEANAARAVGDDDAIGPSILNSIPALAAIADARDRLAAKGVRLGALYLGDPYGDIAGGVRRGAAFAGRLDVQLDVDAEKVFGLTGGTLHANMFQIHGRDLSKEYVGNFLSINDIAGLPTTRLYELWYEQKFGDSVSVRAGQIGIDVEFLTSSYAANFVNATFGWPGLPTLNLPEGGPAYPLATPAVRVKIDPTPQLSILAAVFDGEPAGPGAGDPQARDRYGLNFRVSDPPLVFLESQYRYNQGKDAVGLPGTAKLGALAHFGRFADQRFGTDGLSLAAGPSNGIARSRSPDIGFYGIMDQLIYRAPGDEAKNGIAVFARAIGSPGSQNPINLYLDAGFNVIGMVPSRPADIFGAAITYANVSPAARGYDRDVNAATGLSAPVRNFEAVIELTYIAQIIPGLNLQPDLQYIIHPGGNVADPLGSGLAPIRNALVVGVTTQVRF
jgi:porin